MQNLFWCLKLLQKKQKTARVFFTCSESFSRTHFIQRCSFYQLRHPWVFWERLLLRCKAFFSLSIIRPDPRHKWLKAVALSRFLQDPKHPDLFVPRLRSLLFIFSKIISDFFPRKTIWTRLTVIIVCVFPSLGEILVKAGEPEESGRNSHKNGRTSSVGENRNWGPT